MSLQILQFLVPSEGNSESGVYTLRGDHGSSELAEGNGILSIQQINEIEQVYNTRKRRVDILEKLVQE